MSKNLLPRLLKQSLDQIMSNRFGRYSKYIIQDRALPDVRDGLKPVQRRILFAMNELGLTHNKTYKKSARIVGEVIGKYHPHGDSSIYEALVRMSQNWKINIPLISMHGNNGSVDNDPAAAMRYTEVRLAKITNELLRGIHKNTVSFSSNFDDSEIEPTVLPAGFPNLIINGAKGIAAGYATEMPPHNLGEVIDGTIAMIKNPSIKLETLMTYIKGPDFPTGGIVQGFNGIYSAFEKGKGKIIIRSKVKVVNSKDQHLIIINEIPYGVIKSKLVRDIDEIRYNKNIHGIKEIRDETDRNGISIVIELMRDTNTKFILNYLYSKTSLQIYYNYNNVVIKNRAPKLLSLTDLISCFIMHQIKIQRNLLEFELNKDKNRLEVILGLIKVADIFDEVVEIIKKTSGSKQGVIKALMLKFNFTKVQTNAIAELKLYRLSSADQSIYKIERDELCKRINNIEQIIYDKNKFNNYLIKLLKEIKKHFAIKRKTILEEKIEKIELNNEKLIEHKDIFIGISKLGYIKSLSNRSFNSNKFKDYGLKEGDSIVFLEKVNTSYKMLIFTSGGRYIYIPSYLVSKSKFKSVGHHINNYSSLIPEEKIVSVISTKNFSYQAIIILITKFGKAKRVKLGSFKVSRFTKQPLIAIKIKLNNDKLIDAKVSNGDKKLIIITSNTKAVHYSESLLPIQGPKSYGVIGILLKNNYITSFSLVEFHDILAIISDKGGLKRIKVSKIPQTKRIAIGKSIYKTSKLNPHYIIYSDVVNPNTEILFFENKQIIIYNAKKIPINSLAMRLSQIGPKSIIDGKIKKYQIINNLF